MNINKYWEEGKYVDLWSVNHVLAGIVLALLTYNLNIPSYWLLVLATFLFVGWEIGEVLAGFGEHPKNIMTDIILDFCGFFIMMYYLDKSGSEAPWHIAVWLTLIIAFNLWGFIAYKKRSGNGHQ